MTKRSLERATRDGVDGNLCSKVLVDESCGKKAKRTRVKKLSETSLTVGFGELRSSAMARAKTSTELSHTRTTQART